MMMMIEIRHQRRIINIRKLNQMLEYDVITHRHSINYHRKNLSITTIGAAPTIMKVMIKVMIWIKCKMI